MFSVSSEPVLLSEAGLHGLCVSLNTPVLNIDELPVGPARAGIVVFDGGYGAFELAIAIRSVETRQVLIYSFQGRIGKKTPAQAMEVAANFAEGMGFLFDEDLVSSSSDGRSRAMRLWLDLTEVPNVSEVVELSEERPRLSPAIPLEQPYEELVLEQMLELEQATATEQADWQPEPEEAPAEELWLEEATSVAAPAAAESAALPEPAELPEPVEFSEVVELAAPAQLNEQVEVAPAAQVEASEPAPAPRVSLTKFRQPPLHAPPTAPTKLTPLAAAAQQESANSGSALGRISLVRKQLDTDTGESAPAKPSLLLRLLGSF
jgi:hypothetical protein